MLITIIVLLIALYATRSNAEYNLNGWKRSAYLCDDSNRERDHYKKEWQDMMKCANQQSDLAEKYRQKLRKYGLQDL